MKRPKLLYISLSSLLLFTITVILVLTGLSTGLDNSANSAITHIQTPVLMALAKIADVLFDTLPMLAISIIISILFWFRGSRRHAIQFALTMAAEAIILFLIKIMIQRARPGNELLPLKDYAFPSGHTTAAVVFFGLLAYFVLRKNYPNKSRVLLGASLTVILIAFSRLYLNVHWLTDIMGGLLLGTFILAASILIRKSSA